MQSVAKALYKPSTHPPVPVLEDYDPSNKSGSARNSVRATNPANLAPPSRARASLSAHRNSIASVATGASASSSSVRTSIAEAEREAEQAALREHVTKRLADEPSSPFVFPALKPFIESGQLLALLQQDALVEAGDELGEHRFDVDMAAGKLTFTGDDGRTLECGAHLLASIAPGPRSILWGWAHPRGDDVSLALRKAGEEHRLPELVAEELPFPDTFDPSEDDIAHLAHQVGAAAVGILARGPYYSAPNGTSRVLFILDAPLPSLTLATAVAKAPRILASGLINNPRRAVEGLATMMKWSATPVADGKGIELGDGSSSATVMFDDNGRWTGMTGTLSGAAKAPADGAATGNTPRASTDGATSAPPAAPTVSATA